MTPEKIPKNERGEFSDDISDPSVEEIQQQIRRYPTGSVEFIDAYRKVKAHFLIRFRSREGKEFLACVQRDWRELGLLETVEHIGSELEPRDFWPTTLQRRFLILSEALRRTYHRHGQDQTVLVDYVQSVELPEEQISSLVWVETVENFARLVPQTWYDSVAEGLVSLGGFRDWELSVGSDDFDQPASEVVERTTETMQCITDYEWEVAGDGWNLADIIRDLSSLRIRIEGNIYRVSIPEFKMGDIKLLDVLFGPIVLV